MSSVHTDDGSEIWRTSYWLLVYLIIYKVLYMPGGCLGFLPSAPTSEPSPFAEGKRYKMTPLLCQLKRSIEQSNKTWGDFAVYFGMNTTQLYGITEIYYKDPYKPIGIMECH